MHVFVTNDPQTSGASVLTISELVITEFDQWTNPRDSMLSGTTITWSSDDFRQDDFLEPAA